MTEAAAGPAAVAAAGQSVSPCTTTRIQQHRVFSGWGLPGSRSRLSRSRMHRGRAVPPTPLPPSVAAGTKHWTWKQRQPIGPPAGYADRPTLALTRSKTQRVGGRLARAAAPVRALHSRSSLSLCPPPPLSLCSHSLLPPSPALFSPSRPPLLHAPAHPPRPRPAFPSLPSFLCRSISALRRPPAPTAKAQLGRLMARHSRDVNANVGTLWWDGVGWLDGGGCSWWSCRRRRLGPARRARPPSASGPPHARALPLLPNPSAESRPDAAQQAPPLPRPPPSRRRKRARCARRGVGQRGSRRAETVVGWRGGGGLRVGEGEGPAGRGGRNKMVPAKP